MCSSRYYRTVSHGHLQIQVYNSSNNELVRTNTLVKGAIIQIDAAPFRQWYESHVCPVFRLNYVEHHILISQLCSMHSLSRKKEKLPLHRQRKLLLNL